MTNPKYMKSPTNQSLEFLKGSKLIIPSVSLGNVPQLATDLLIHNFNFTRVGHLQDQYLYPFASPIDYAMTEKEEPGISSALELYYSREFNLTLIQQRSPIIPTFGKTFVVEVISPFVNEHEFQQVLLLDSGDSGLKENVVPDYIETYTNEDLLSKSMESLKLTDTILSLNETIYGQCKYFKHLINELSGKHSLSVLVIYVYEGQNFHEANVLADKVVKKLELQLDSWVKPKSWEGVYGDKPAPIAMEDGIYG